MKFYRGAANAARAYVERDRSRADDYYLDEGTGVAERLTSTPDGVEHAGSMDGETYEQWVAGVDLESGKPKGRLRNDSNGLRFVEVTVNGPKTWSLAAAPYPDISAVLDETTLDTHAHLWPDSDESTRSTIDAVMQTGAKELQSADRSEWNPRPNLTPSVHACGRRRRAVGLDLPRWCALQDLKLGHEVRCARWSRMRAIWRHGMSGSVMSGSRGAN